MTMTKEQFEDAYIQLELLVEVGKCTWRYAMARAAMLGIEYAATNQACVDSVLNRGKLK